MDIYENRSCFRNIKNKYNRCKIKCGYYYDNLKPYIRLSLEFTKIIIGCLLFIFVPQVCKGPDDTVQNLIHNYHINITLDQIRRPCTFEDNFFDVNDYKIFVITWNFLTVICFLTNFCWEIKREKYLQSHFESTIKKSITNINDVFAENKKLDHSYRFKTKILYYINYVCLFMILTNILFTSIMIYKYYYDGFRSVTGLLTCVILIFQKLYYNYDTLNISLNEGYALSTSLTKPHDYNTLEPIKFRQNEYIKKYNKKKSYRIYYLGKETEDDVEYDKYAMQTYNEIDPTPILIPYDKNKSNTNKLNKVVRQKIKERIKNEIRTNNADNTMYNDIKNSLDNRELKKRKILLNISEENIQTEQNNFDKQNNFDNQIVLYKSNETKTENETENNTNQIVLYKPNETEQAKQEVPNNNDIQSNSIEIVKKELEQLKSSERSLRNNICEPISPRRRQNILSLSLEDDMDIEEINDMINMKSHVNDEIKLKNTKIPDNIKAKINERKDLMNQINNNTVTLNKISETIV